MTSPSQCIESELSHLVKLRERAIHEGLELRASNLGKYINEEFQRTNDESDSLRRAVHDLIFDGVITIR